MLADKIWLLTSADGPNRYLYLLPSGRIGSGWGSGLARWVLEDGHLYLLDEEAQRRCVFAVLAIGTTLVGETLPRRENCQLTLLRTLPSPVVPNEIVAPDRRNLVVLRAGPASLHPLWLDGCPPDGRNWDLCISWYGDETANISGPFDRVVYAKGSKFRGLAKFLATDAAVWGYDHVWFPDDDLLISWQEINRLFDLCAEYKLSLAQPSLHPDSCINASITRRNPECLLRYTTFVEIMAPVFAQTALRRVAATFDLNASGYGLDHLWPTIIDASSTGIAIIDAVSALHTRLIGNTYSQAEAIREGWLIEHEFQLVGRYEILGAIFAKPLGFVKRRATLLRETAPFAQRQAASLAALEELAALEVAFGKALTE